MKKIIVVEDNPAFKLLIRSSVEKEFPECEIREFISAEEAKEAIAGNESDFDVLILDGNLDWGGHGSTVLEALSDEQKKRTVVCSGNSTFVRTCRAHGVKVYLDKCFSAEDILEMEKYILKTLERVST